MFSVLFVLANKENFLDFSKVLSSSQNPRVYELDFIHALVDEFWSSNQDKLVRRFFLPWLLYLFSCFYLFSTVHGIRNEEDSETESIYKLAMIGQTLVLYAY